MKVCIAGPRDYHDYEKVCQAIEESGFTITEVVSGGANGVDKLGEKWAEDTDTPVRLFPAEWNNLKQTGAVVKKNKWGKNYNANAGFYRNKLMAQYADALIAIKVNGGSPGTGNMIKTAKDAGIEVFVFDPDENLQEEEVGYVF